VSTPYGRREKGEVSYERREREREKKGKGKTKGREKWAVTNEFMGEEKGNRADRLRSSDWTSEN
jgi:hypothetical protein